MRKKENINEKVEKKETYVKRVKRNIVTILIFIFTRYKWSTDVIIIENKTITIIKTAKLFKIMTLSYPTYCNKI